MAVVRVIRDYCLTVVVLIGLVFALCAQEVAPTATPTADPWPRELKTEKATFSIHQPQIESWDGQRTQAYAAVSAKMGKEENSSYGILRFSAHTSVDRPTRTVHFDDFRVEKLGFPATPDRDAEFTSALKTLSTKNLNSISLDRFESALSVSETLKNAKALPLKNDPPKILFQVVPSLLVYVDGQPVYRPEPNTSLERIINTRPLIVKDSSGKHYIRIFDGWLVADALGSSWSYGGKRPGDLKKVLEAAKKDSKIDLLEGQPDPETKKEPKLEKGKVPLVVVATEPTEMIVSEGEWNWAPIAPTALEYVSNTTGHVFRNKTDQKIYVLISGRWFRAPDRQGPWEFVPGGQLPAGFKNMPDDSPKENVKASVPDTPQAEEAVIANMIPQAATVKRAEAKLTQPIFDGQPQLKAIEGTQMEYVVNTPTPIIKVDATSFYAVENGVWFKSASVQGPWTIADAVPTAIYSIPPSSPLHYVTYVQIYRSTPETVTVGYTPGYMGAVVTSGSGYVVMYGTGYHYSPWVGSYWYGPPVTYGFGTSITYTPWTGWTYGYGYGWSWGYSTVTVGWGWGTYPWWGPVGWAYYYPPVYMGGAAWGPRGAAVWGPYGGWAATSGNVYGRWGSTAVAGRQSAGYNPWTGNAWASRVGTSYNSRTGTLAAGQRSAVGNVYTGNYAYGSRGAATNARQGVSASGGRATVGNVYTGNEATVARGQITNNRTGESVRVGGISGESGSIGRVGDNVFASQDGNVYRHNGDSWQQMNGDRWSEARNSAQVQNLDRERAARYQGNQRTQSYGQGATRSMPRSMPRGGRRR